MPIRPIETEYASILFRSRLEARWAVFFDALGVRWVYEPEGYETPEGRYLPDFWLPDIKMIVEVKPEPACVLKHARLRHVADSLGCRATIVDQVQPQVPPAMGGSCCYPKQYCNDEFHFGDFKWHRCPWCGRLDLRRFIEAGCDACQKLREQSGEFHDAKWTDDAAREALCDRLDALHSEANKGFSDPRILEAYRAARGARFEHGHSGRTL